jgi:hypothetical protein
MTSIPNPWQKLIHRLVQAQPAFLYQDHRRGGGDRLGHRGDAEDRVAPHRVGAAERLQTDRIGMHLAPPADQRNESRQFAALDEACHDVMHATKPHFGQSSSAHRLCSPPCFIGLR